MRYVLAGLLAGLASAAILSLGSALILDLSSDDVWLVSCFWGSVMGVLGIAIGYELAGARTSAR